MKLLAPDPATRNLAYLAGMSPKPAQMGHDVMDRLTQNLIIAFAVENCEIAMYEARTAAAEAGGDSRTAELARSIQAEEQATAGQVWQRSCANGAICFQQDGGRRAAHALNGGGWRSGIFPSFGATRDIVNSLLK